jgi:hypothetical protein
MKFYLKCLLVKLTACSILDIGDMNGAWKDYKPDEVDCNPGKFWMNTGPKYFLG